MDDKFFSISQAAKYLGVFSLTLRNWEHKGLIRSFRTPGGHRRFKKSELDRIIGVQGTGDKLKEAIEGLEKIGLENGRRESLKKIIMNLKCISDEL